MLKSFFIITESINVSDSSGSKANVAIIENLVALGHRVKILHYTRKQIHIKGTECIAIKELSFNFNYFASRTQRLLKRYFNIELHRILEKKLGFSFTYFNDAKSISKAISKHYDNEDIVLTLSKGASFKPHYAMLSHPKLHQKWMAYVHDPFPFHFYPEPYTWQEPGYSQKEEFFKKVSICCKWAAFPSLLLQQWMEDKFLDFLGKGVIIPHQKIALNTTGVKLPEYFISNTFNILHSGNLMKQRDPRCLVKAFKLFLEKCPEARKKSKLLLIGASSYHRSYLKQIEQELPELYISEGSVEFKTVFKMQQETSVNVILEAKAKISPFLPGKFTHCVQANKPILHLGPQKSETRRLLGADYKYSLPADDVVGIAKHMQELYETCRRNKAFELSRPDLVEYLSVNHLKTVINDL